MHGPQILARYLCAPGPADKYGQRWQYHSRSDRHSKVGCWGVALDLLATSSLMQQHARDGKLVLGVNHEMRDYKLDRKKDLDLVIARPGAASSTSQGSLQSLADQYDLPLTATEKKTLAALPDIPVGAVGAVLVALEAKACMTAHVKSLPRLYDELNSSHLAIHGASSKALAIAYVQVNHASQFVSPIGNSERLAEGRPVKVSTHKQPKDTQRVLDKVAQLPRRTSKDESGFDAIGISLFDLQNDGSAVDLVTATPAPQAGSNYHYETMIVRMANEYDATFSHI